ncbi:beta strand repeat-containing protein, partial [Helicobacter brantae]
MTKKNKTLGGGVVAKSNTLSSQTSVAKPSRFFKPLVASSLALALGVSVAVATDPSIQINGSDVTLQQLQSNGGNVLAKWAESGSYTTIANSTNNTPFNHFKFQFQKNASPSVGNVLTDQNNTYEILPRSADGNPSLTLTNNSGKGLMIGSSGTGDLIMSFALATGNDAPIGANATLNFTSTTQENGRNVALYGNLVIQGGYGNWSIPSNPITHLTANFSGDLKGNVTQLNPMSGYTPFSKMTFTNGSNITGNVSIAIGGATFEFDSGGIQGNLSITPNGNSMSDVNLLRTTGSNLAIGKTGGFIEGQLSTSGGGDTNFLIGYKDSVKDGTKVISLNPEDTTKFSITRGNFTFYNMKQLNFVDDSNQAKTFTLQTGTIDSATFQFDRSLIATPSSPSRAGGDALTTIMTGNLTALNGKSIRFSLIDDENITEKIDESTLKTLQVNGTITITGGGLSLFYNDRLDCFEAKLQATGGITQSGGYIGRNDAFFEANTFTEANGKKNITTIQGTNGGISHLRFNDNVNITGGISSTSGNGTELYFYQGVNVSADTNGNAIQAGGNNTIYLGETSQITGKVIANGGKTNALKLNNSANVTITGEISTNAGTQTISQIDGSSATLSLQDSLIKVYGGGTADITINADNLTIGGSSSLLADGNNNGINTISITTNTANISLTSISATIDNRKKNLINIASGTFEVTNSISSSGGVNQIASGAKNTINSISSNGNGTNTITLSGVSNTIGGISNSGGINSKNEISFTNAQATDSITGNIQAIADGHNRIASTGNLAIQGANLNIQAQWGQNYISGQDIVLGEEANKITIKSYGNRADKKATNEIIATGSLTGYISSIQAYDVIVGDNGFHTNILTGGANSNLTIGSMSASTSNQNTNTITVGNNSQILVTGNITQGDGGQNIFHLTGDTSTLKLQGQNNAISTISGYVAPTPPAGESRVTSGVSTLILDGANATTSNSGVSATITNAIDTGKLAINFNGNTNNIAKLTLSAGGNALESITLGNTDNANSTNNTLELSQGQTSIAQNVAIGANQALAFDLANGTTLTFNSGLTTAGTATFNLGSSSATTTTTTISGEIENSGNNVFNVKSTTTTLKYGANGLGFSSGTNTINFENTSGATLNWQDSEGNNQAITTSGGNTTINFTNSGTIAGGVSTSDSGSTTIAISDGKSATIQSSGISTSGGTTAISFLGNNTTPTDSTGSLSGNISTSGGTTTITFAQDGGTYTIANSNTFSTSSEGKNIIDLSSKSATIGNNLSFTGNSVSGSGGNIIKIGDGKTLTLQNDNGDATILTTQGGATYLNFAGTSNLSGNITTTAGSTTFNLGDGSNLANTDSTTATITGTITNTNAENVFNINSATTNFKYGNTNATSGLAFSEGTNKIVFTNTSVNGATLAWQDSSGATQAIATSGGNTTINFTNSGTISGGVSTSGGSTTIAISGGETATINNITSQTYGISTSGGSTNINFIGASGTLVSSISTTAGNTTFNLGDDSNLANTDSTTATITGTITNTDGTNQASDPYNGGTNTFNINSATTNFQYGSGLAFSEGINKIVFTNTSVNGATLNWQNSSGTTQAITTSGGNTEINFTNSGTISGGVSTSGGNTQINIENSKIANIPTLSTSTNGATFINFKGNTGTLVGDISTSGGTTTLELTDKIATITGSMATSGGNTEISFAGVSKLSVSNGISTTNSGTTTLNIADNAVATINGSITTGATSSGFSARGATPATNVTFKSTENKTSTLILQGLTNQITTLTMGAGENILALTEQGGEGQKARKKRSAVIDNVVKNSTGSLKLVSQISSDKADTFLIKGAIDKTRGAEDSLSPYQISLVLAEGTDSNQIAKNSPVLVATVKSDSGIEFEKTSKFVSGFVYKEADFITTLTDEKGNANESGDYTSYLVGSIVTDGIVMAEQAVTATAFTLNYDLYMANLNSLNKRMGELRENNHSQ